MKPIPAILFIIASITIIAPILSAEENPQEETLYKLTIAGENITRIVLVDSNNKDYRFENMSEPVMLPTGRYRIREVYLEGGFQSSHWSDSGLEWADLGPDKEATLKIGPPLTQSISIDRQGPILKLSYKLTGQGGENYSMSDRKKAPAFDIYKDGEKIDSCKFEYG